MLAASKRVAIQVDMDGDYAHRLERSLGRIIEAVDKMDSDRRIVLINTGTVDHLTALRTTLAEALDG